MYVRCRNNGQIDEPHYGDCPAKGNSRLFSFIITQYWAIRNAFSLIAVDIPEGITSISSASFGGCSSLKDIKFPKSLTSIGVRSFANCSSLVFVDLLHTHVQALGYCAFGDCTSLREMKAPDSLQELGGYVFENCSKLVPSHINVDYDSDTSDDDDTTSEVVAYLHSIQYSPHTPKKA